MRVRSSLLCLAFLAPLVLVSGGCDRATASPARAEPLPSSATPADPSAKPPPAHASALFGVVESADTVRVHSQVDGTVAELLVRVGDTVHVGDLLAQLSNPELVYLVDAAKEKLAQARALAQAARVTASMSALESATSSREWELDYRAAVAALDLARHETVRMTEQDESNMAYSLSDVERGQADLDRALNQLTQAELQREATQAHTASIGITLATTKREEERKVELQSKNFASASAVEEAQLAHATARARSDEHQKDLARGAEDMNAADDEIAAARRYMVTWSDALDHERKALEALGRGRVAAEAEADLQMQSAGARLEATRAVVDLDAGRSVHTVAAADAAVRAAAASLRLAEQQVAWLGILAPADGVVSEINVATGELARSGRSSAAPGPATLVLGSAQRLVVRLVVEASGLAHVVLGGSVRVTPSGGSGGESGGPLSAAVVSVVADELDGSRYVVTVRLPEAADGFPLGTVVRVEFD